LGEQEMKQSEVVPDPCYMCDEVSSTREHVPPQCFFPNGQRENLWTVPSCALHNLGNSKDVEYVRNVLVTQRGTNETASELFQVVKRSWDRSPALFSRTFHDFRTALVEGEEAGVFPFDLPRIKAVMTAVCHALAFRDFGRQYHGDWRIVFPRLGSTAPTPEFDRLRSVLDAAVCNPIPTPHSGVFTYGVQQMEPAGLLLRLVFYCGFVVFAWPVLPGQGGA
jgi:hypothetical protein